jgi:hypothetical protein
MLFIDMQRIYPSIREFIPDLQDAHQEIMQAADGAARSDVCRRRYTRWTALREAFEAASYGKCWYTECKDDGANCDIDHFRPKLAVSEVSGHKGYY